MRPMQHICGDKDNLLCTATEQMMHCHCPVLLKYTVEQICQHMHYFLIYQGGVSNLDNSIPILSGTE